MGHVRKVPSKRQAVVDDDTKLNFLLALEENPITPARVIAIYRAAKDGLLEVLKEATKRDCNCRDEQGMTPTLYAAFHGNLDALRLLCGEGAYIGDPDKADLFGNTALHLAAAQGHKHIVTFLINFGANIYSTDVDGRTAQELAGINSRDDILRFIDGIHAKLEASDKKKAKALQEKAKEDAKKRIKIENNRGIYHKFDSDLPQERRNTYSAIISGGTMTGKGSISTVQRRILASRNNRLGQIDDDFKVSEIEDGKEP
ncbi:hypothetical protein NQ318_014057 [Aromia moschata]|uniref:Uncharacterized protein n=1 Tax=Aromia moschata TaxID=1265417 RepID=A0AAV8YZR0_9CUCU|nr:hypothetical protein NQ318_014057 [Aromia moschata]